jgi:hypothetical protein
LARFDCKLTPLRRTGGVREVVLVRNTVLHAAGFGVRGTSPFPATVYVLTNGTCASACLDFADIALNMPGVVHIGAETGADGLLMEVRSMDLRSGRGSLSLPIKVVRGRARGNLESYTPDVSFDGPWTDEAVRAWVLSLAP